MPRTWRGTGQDHTPNSITTSIRPATVSIAQPKQPYLRPRFKKATRCSTCKASTLEITKVPQRITCPSPYTRHKTLSTLQTCTPLILRMRYAPGPFHFSSNFILQGHPPPLFTNSRCRHGDRTLLGPGLRWMGMKSCGLMEPE